MNIKGEIVSQYNAKYFKCGLSKLTMERLKFDSNGKLIGVDNKILDFASEKKAQKSGKLKTSDELEFLKDNKELEIGDNSSWSLYSNGHKLEPLRFSNNKTQQDVVNEVVDLIKNGNKIIFIHGVCGTGKSAIALNIARLLGRASIVVPVKGLQRQYEEDYMSKKYHLKPNGAKMRIAMITGRDNHDSIINPGVSCADPFLPETIKIAEKNYKMIKEFYESNPLIKTKADIDLETLKRISIAPANPYWSPILPADFELHLRDATKKRYTGLENKEFIFYHRKRGCSYYDQYQAYISADVIIFNSAKYKIEAALDRKPQTDLEIIDEADEFLDNFSTQQELNITKLISALKFVIPEDSEAKEDINDIIDLLKLEEKNKSVLGIDENQIFHIDETKFAKILRLFLKNPEVESEISLDELNYSNKAIETAKMFNDYLDDTYLTYRKSENELYANIVSTNLSKKFREIVEKSKSIVFMSGTLHSESVLKNIYGIKDFKVVDAETLHQGTIEIHRTGKEFDCRYSNFSSGKYSRRDYLIALSCCMDNAKKPVLVHVNAFEDLPTEDELAKYSILNLMSREKLYSIQSEDKTGRMISLFKSKLSDSLFTTKCSRGVDFPGDVCNSIIFTKYPNPNINGTFWKILQKTHQDYFWDFYKDKARREFLQRIYRAIRSKDDHVYILSPDSRVLDAVRDLQLLHQ